MSEVLEDLIEKWIQADAPVPESPADVSDEDYEDVKGYIPKSPIPHPQLSHARQKLMAVAKSPNS